MILLLEIETMESKKLKLFSDYLSRLARVLSTITAGTARAEEEMFASKQTIKNLASLEKLVPYLNNTSEKAIFGSKLTKGEHEIVKLQNEEDMVKTLKNLINELNRPVQM